MNNKSIDNKSIYSQNTDSKVNDCEAIYDSYSIDRKIYVLQCIFLL